MSPRVSVVMPTHNREAFLIGTARLTGLELYTSLEVTAAGG